MGICTMESCLQSIRISPEDARLTTPQLITKYGYEAEIHYVTTEDGYILQLHRIPGGPKSPPRKGKKVVFLAHGLSLTSSSYVLSGPEHGLGYLLADNDYDVWFGNNRGNTYSTNHTHLRPKGWFHSKKFWNFSWHEIGYYDLPASIDYVLNKTGQEKLQFIGYSQGTTTFFVMASERPEYNDKIEMMHALAPAVFLKHNKSPADLAITPFLSILHTLRILTGVDYLMDWPTKAFLNLAGSFLCREKPVSRALFKNFWFMFVGFDSKQKNAALLPAMLAHAPAGSSTNQLIHFGQLVNSGHFRQFDHGFIKNKLKYGQFTPPDYNLKNVRIPVALYYAHGDWMAPPEDIRTLKKHLPNVVHDYPIPHKTFSHIDIMWGVDAPIVLYDEILETMKKSKKYNKKTYIPNSTRR